MTTQEKLENWVKVKTALAEKYERLSRTRRSKPGKATLLHHAERFRQQAANGANKARAAKAARG